MNKNIVFSCSLLCISIAVAASAKKHIPDVVVKPSLTRKSISSSHPYLLTHEMIRANGATSLADLFKSNGFLQLQDASGTGSQAAISMRGFGANASSNTLIMINGIPITNPDLAPPNLNTIPLAGISEIEITAGSESVLYGDQAVGGVINIVTHHNRDNLFQMQCGTGSYHANDCHIRFGNSYRNINYQALITNRKTDNYREHNHYSNQAFIGSANYLSGSTQVKAIINATQESMQYPGPLTSAEVRQNRRQANNSTDFFKDKNQSLLVNFNSPVSTIWSVNTDAYINQVKGNGVLFSPFSQSRWSTYFKPVITAQKDPYHLKSGIDFRIDQYHLGSQFGTTNNRQWQSGLFLLLKKQLNDKLDFSIGARGALQSTQLHTFTYAQTINRVFTTTLGTTYAISRHISTYLRRAGNYRFPKAEENSANNQPLRTQRGISYEAGIAYQEQTRLIDFSIYQLNLRDEIAFNPLQTPQNPFGSNQNLSPTTRTGSTLSFKSSVINHLTVDAALNYVYARFQTGINNGNHIPLVSDLVMHGGFLYQINDGWEVYTEANYTGKQFPANDNANITGGIGGYTIFNFNIRYHFHTLTAAAHLNNIFNRNYYLYTVYQTGAVSQFFYPAPDRNFMLSVNWDMT